MKITKTAEQIRFALGSSTTYNNATSGLTANNVQGAIDELAADIAAFAPIVGEILISDTPSTPLIFADLLQNEAQDDLLYADP